MTSHSHWCTDCKREWSCKDVKCWMAVVSKCFKHSNPLKIKETMFRGIRGFAFVCLVMMLCGWASAKSAKWYLDIKTITHIALAECHPDKKVQRRLNCSAVVDFDALSLDDKARSGDVQRADITIEK